MPDKHDSMSSTASNVVPQSPRQGLTDVTNRPQGSVRVNVLKVPAMHQQLSDLDSQSIELRNANACWQAKDLVGALFWFTMLDRQPYSSRRHLTEFMGFLSDRVSDVTLCMFSQYNLVDLSFNRVMLSTTGQRQLFAIIQANMQAYTFLQDLSCKLASGYLALERVPDNIDILLQFIDQEKRPANDVLSEYVNRYMRYLMDSHQMALVTCFFHTFSQRLPRSILINSHIIVAQRSLELEQRLAHLMLAVFYREQTKLIEPSLERYVSESLCELLKVSSKRELLTQLETPDLYLRGKLKEISTYIDGIVGNSRVLQRQSTRTTNDMVTDFCLNVVLPNRRQWTFLPRDNNVLPFKHWNFSVDLSVLPGNSIDSDASKKDDVIPSGLFRKTF